MDKHKKLFLLFILAGSGGILILLFLLKDIPIMRGGGAISRNKKAFSERE
jgi:hypothetical protein